MPEGILVALRSARRWATVHPAPAVRHRGRLAGRPPAGFRTASRGFVHRQLHGVEPLFFYHPPGGDLPNDGLAALIDVHMLHNNLLLASTR